MAWTEYELRSLKLQEENMEVMKKIAESLEKISKALVDEENNSHVEKQILKD